MPFTAMCTSKIGAGMFSETIKDIFPTKQLAWIAVLKRFGPLSKEHITILDISTDEPS